MPAYSFKERFVPFVKDGSKPGTVRAIRKSTPKAGQQAHLYYAMRTMFCTKLVDPSPVIRRVVHVIIREEGIIMVNLPYLEPDQVEALEYWKVKAPKDSAISKELTEKQRDLFAYMDGFRAKRGSWVEMLEYFNETALVGADKFIGQWIVWGELGCLFLDEIFPPDDTK